MSGAQVLRMSDYRKREHDHWRRMARAETRLDRPRGAARAAIARVNGAGAVLEALPLAQGRRWALGLGAGQRALDDVMREAIAFTRWRLVHDVRGDFAVHASDWAVRGEGSRSAAAGRVRVAPGPTSSAESRAVRWAMTRFVNLLLTGLSVSEAQVEAVAIPLEASAARRLSRAQ